MRTMNLYSEGTPSDNTASVGSGEDEMSGDMQAALEQARQNGIGGGNENTWAAGQFDLVGGNDLTPVMIATGINMGLDPVQMYQDMGNKIASGEAATPLQAATQLVETQHAALEQQAIQQQDRGGSIAM